MDLELLRTFVTVAGAPTLTAAAGQLRVTKSAVSQQLKTLEAQMGMPLFERVGRGLELTPAARSLCDSLRPVFAQADDAVQRMREAHGSVRGVMRIGAPRPFTHARLATVLADLLARHPDLVLDVAFGTPTELETMLLARAIDLAVLVRPPEAESLVTAPLFTETFELVAAPEYLDTHGSPRTADDLAAHRFIVFDRDEPMHRSWWRATFGGRSALRGHVVARVASLETMLALATAGAGMAVLPDYFVTPALGARTVTTVRIPHAKGRAQNAIVLAWRRGAVTTAKLVAVRDAVLAPDRR